MSEPATSQSVGAFESRLVWPAVIVLVGLVGLEVASAGRRPLQVLGEAATRNDAPRMVDGGARPAAVADRRVDLNTAGPAELEQLPAIGKKRAADIIAYRKANGPFRRPEDVMKIRGIKEGIFRQIAPHVRVTEPVGDDRARTGGDGARRSAEAPK